MVNVKAALVLLILINGNSLATRAVNFDSLLVQTDSLLNAGSLTEAKPLAYLALQIAEGTQSRLDDALANFKLANILQESGNYLGAIPLYEASTKWADLEGDDALLAKSLLHFGGMKIKMSHYSEGELNVNRALEYGEALNDEKIVAFCYQELGTSRFIQKRYLEALEYYKNALEKAIYIKNEFLESVCYHNLGLTYRELGSIQEALFYSKKALAMRIKRGDTRFVNDYFRDLVYLQLDTFTIEDALATNAAFFKTLDMKDMPLNSDILEPQAYIQEQILIGVIKNRHELETTRKRKQLFSFLAYGFGLLLVTFGILFLYWKRKVRKHIKQIEARGTYVTGTLGERIQPLIQTNNSLYVECYTLLAAGLNITQVATYLKRDRKTIYAYINDIGEILRVEDVKADALKYGKRVSNDPETASVPDSKTGD